MFDKTVRAALIAALLWGASAGDAAAQAASGTAVVEVVFESPGTPVTFTGVPAGTVAAGATLEAEGLSPGRYVSTQSELSPGVALVGIACDDEDSVGDVPSRRATFNVGEDEVVTCVFTYASRPTSMDETGSSSGSGSASGTGTNPFETPDDGFDNFPIPDDLPPSAGSATVPKAGRWDVTNHEGEMACTGMVSMTRSLSASRESGTLEVRDGGETVIGKGLSDETADVTVHRVAGLSGRYAGSVGGSGGDIPMTIDFNWQLVTGEWIVGYLSSEVSQSGMTCKMFRTFELRYAGGG